MENNYSRKRSEFPEETHKKRSTSKPVMKHPIKKWEVTLKELEDEEGKKYKVTRRIPEVSVTETKIFDSKEEARQQLNAWLK